MYKKDSCVITVINNNVFLILTPNGKIHISAENLNSQFKLLLDLHGIDGMTSNTTITITSAFSPALEFTTSISLKALDLYDFIVDLQRKAFNAKINGLSNNDFVKAFPYILRGNF